MTLAASCCCQVVAAEMFMMKNIKSLVHVMTDTYNFILETKPLEKIESHRELIALISKQTVECGYFIMRLMRMNATRKLLDIWKDHLSHVTSRWEYFPKTLSSRDRSQNTKASRAISGIKDRFATASRYRYGNFGTHFA